MLILFGFFTAYLMVSLLKDENHLRRLRFKNKMLLGGFKQTDKGWVKYKD